MGADAILTKIEEKSRNEAEAIRRAGEERAREAAEAIRAEAGKNAEAIRARGEKDAADIRYRERLKSEMECRKNTLAAKRALLDEAFAKAAEELQALDGAAWEALAERLVLEECMTGSVEVCLSRRDTERFGTRMAALLPVWEEKLTAARGESCRLRLGEPVEMQGGLFFRGEICDVDASFGMLLRDVREQKEYEIASLLFNGEMNHD